MLYELHSAVIHQRLRARRADAERHRAVRAARARARAGPPALLPHLRDRLGVALVRVGLRLTSPATTAALRERR